MSSVVSKRDEYVMPIFVYASGGSLDRTLGWTVVDVLYYACHVSLLAS